MGWFSYKLQNTRNTWPKKKIKKKTSPADHLPRRPSSHSWKQLPLMEESGKNNVKFKVEEKGSLIRFFFFFFFSRRKPDFKMEGVSVSAPVVTGVGFVDLGFLLDGSVLTSLAGTTLGVLLQVVMQHL